MTAIRPTRDGFLLDPQGRLIPVELVKPEHLLEDDLVRTIYAEAAERSEQLRQDRARWEANIAAYQDILAEKHGANRGVRHGNIQLSTYDGTKRVMVAVNDQVEFGPELQTAKVLIDECLRGWSENSPVELKAFIASAFDVDKKGKLSITRIKSLRRLAIPDPTWQRAMVAIDEAERPARSKSYLRVYSRNAGDDKFTLVPLDLASV